MRNKTSQSNAKYEKFNINDCYEDYKSSCNHFSLKEYRLIVKTYLRIYFYEAFFLKHPIYFFFGGQLMKNRISKSIIKSKLKSQYNELISIEDNVGFHWFNRPFPKFREFVFKKLVGKTGALQKIQREWLQENDVQELPTVQELFNKLHKK